MKIPKTNKIIKAEKVESVRKAKREKDMPTTISFRTTEKSYYHFETVKQRLSEKYKIDFSNTDVIEFALAFAHENFNVEDNE